ncbi:MAG: hypothetical protein DRJ51_02520 [Thermoprotei archaeon]|nr:MAG: hypothetical protein DRJ51_02520 [Thermoprotei archaeon]RLF02992.1 MAG: hypothetical protein DRJ59_02030 [Thermoprotei archaeon]
MEVWRYYKIRIPEMSLVEVLKCNKCGYVEKRRPQKGDFVFKKVGECPKCGGVIFIESIYKEVKARKSER